MKFGATGKFPHGKLGDDDEGALKMAISGRDGNVTINFGKPVAWLAMPPDQAITFASLIVAKANLLKRGSCE